MFREAMSIVFLRELGDYLSSDLLSRNLTQRTGDARGSFIKLF